MESYITVSNKIRKRLNNLKLDYQYTEAFTISYRYVVALHVRQFLLSYQILEVIRAVLNSI